MKPISATQKHKSASYTLSKSQLESLAEGLKDAYIAMDRYLLECDTMDNSGSTLVCVLTTPSYILCANVGDSRAIIGCAGGEVLALSADHKPDNAREKARIERAGSFVAIERVNGELAMSRALGDFQYKQAKHMDISQQAVTCIPEVTIHTRTKSDGILVLACDGVWDVLTNREVIAFVWDHLIAHDTSITMEEAAEAVVNLSLRQGSTDNISVVVSLLNPSQMSGNGGSTAGTRVSQNVSCLSTGKPSNSDSNSDYTDTDSQMPPDINHEGPSCPTPSVVFELQLKTASTCDRGLA